MPTRDELKMMQALPLDTKILKTQQRIREWYDHWCGQVYVSYSGGKDSAVLRHIVKEMYPDVPAVFVDTGLEYPEVKECAKKWADVIIRPKMSFKQVIEKYGYPVISKETSHRIYYARKGSRWALNSLNGLHMVTGNPDDYQSGFCKYKYLVNAPFKICDMCCYAMKKSSCHRYNHESERHAMIGTMAVESATRLSAWLKTGCNAFDSKEPQSTPMAFWTEQDVLQYVVKYNVEIPSVYGDIVEDDKHRLHCTGLQRTGCMFCMFGAHLEKEPNRFQRMKQTHPQIWEYCMKPADEGGLGLREVCEYIGIKVE